MPVNAEIDNRTASPFESPPPHADSPGAAPREIFYSSGGADQSSLLTDRPGAGWGSHRVRKIDLLIVTSQLAIMCDSGIDLAEALHSVARECQQKQLKARLESVYRDVANGQSAAAAMRAHTDVFGEAYVASIAAAEATGTVTGVLDRLTEMIRNEIRLQSSLKSVLAYPIILTGVAMIVMTTLVFFVLPQFGKVFENLGRPAPATTQLLLDTAQVLRDYVWWLLAALGIGVGLLRIYMRTEGARRQRDDFMLNSKLLRRGTRPLLSGRAFRLMGAMLQSGVPLLEAVRLCRASISNRLLRDLFDRLESDVLNGLAMGQALSRATFVPPGAAQMVLTAERTGRLGQVLTKVGEFYEEEGERTVTQTVKMLEPAIIVVMGVIVTGVVLSIMLPLLDVSTISR